MLEPSSNRSKPTRSRWVFDSYRCHPKTCEWARGTSKGVRTLLVSSDGLQPNSDGLQPNSFEFYSDSNLMMSGDCRAGLLQDGLSCVRCSGHDGCTAGGGGVLVAGLARERRRHEAWRRASGAGREREMAWSEDWKVLKGDIEILHMLGQVTRN